MSGLSISAAAWRRGSACLPSDCVEVAVIGGRVLIRDSADQADGPVLIFSREQWRAFTRLLRCRDARSGTHYVSLTRDPAGAGQRSPGDYPEEVAGKSSEAVAA